MDSREQQMTFLLRKAEEGTSVEVYAGHENR